MSGQTYQGKHRYSSDLRTGTHQLLVAVPCRIGDLTDRFFALLDTGSTWCLLPPELAEGLGHPVEEGGSYRLHTRLGTFTGELVRERVIFSPDNEMTEESESDRLAVEATWFLSGDWTGPIVIGWKGCLERMRFGVDPGEEAFYFAELTV